MSFIDREEEGHIKQNGIVLLVCTKRRNYAIEICMFKVEFATL